MGGLGEQEAGAQVPPLPPSPFAAPVCPQPRNWSRQVEIISPASSQWGVVPRWGDPGCVGGATGVKGDMVRSFPKRSGSLCGWLGGRNRGHRMGETEASLVLALPQLISN